jgi:hypothetical protein
MFGTWRVFETYRAESGLLLVEGDAVLTYELLGSTTRPSTSLLTEFARLPVGGQQALAAFSRTWGLIGEHASGDGPNVTTADGSDQPEHIQWIWNHVLSVRVLLELAWHLRHASSFDIEQFVLSTFSLVTEAKPSSTAALEMSVGGDPHRWVITTERDAVDTISEFLEESLTRVLQTSVHHSVVGRPLKLRPMAHGPLGAIYWTLAEIVGGSLDVRRCDECSRVFVMTDRRQRFCPPPVGRSRRATSLCGDRFRRRETT